MRETGAVLKLRTAPTKHLYLRKSPRRRNNHSLERGFYIAQCSTGDDPINYTDLFGLEINGRTITYTMSDERWKDELTGNETEGKTLSQTGCTITELSSAVSSYTGENVTPKDINDDKTNFAPGTDDLDIQKVVTDAGLIYDYWTAEYTDIEDKLIELNDSSSKYYISAQVPYNLAGNIHWVGVIGITIENGKTYIEIAPTSINDTNKGNRQRDAWELNPDGTMRIDVTDINKITTYEVPNNCNN